MISVEGLVMPNKPLTNLEIIDAVRKLEIPRFRGVFLRDNLPVEPKRNGMWSTKPRPHVWKRNTLGGVVQGQR